VRNPPMDAMRWAAAKEQAQRSLTVERVSVRCQDARGYYTMAERQRDRQTREATIRWQRGREAERQTENLRCSLFQDDYPRLGIHDSFIDIA
jgi:hypothetical protein